MAKAKPIVPAKQQAVRRELDGPQANAAPRRAVEHHPLFRSEVANRMFATYEAGDLITVCAWCNRVEIEGDWHPTPHTALAAIEERYTLSHSICPACALGPAN
jgi:hypothetical protein